VATNEPTTSSLEQVLAAEAERIAQQQVTRATIARLAEQYARAEENGNLAKQHDLTSRAILIVTNQQWIDAVNHARLSLIEEQSEADEQERMQEIPHEHVYAHDHFCDICGLVGFGTHIEDADVRVVFEPSLVFTMASDATLKHAEMQYDLCFSHVEGNDPMGDVQARACEILDEMIDDGRLSEQVYPRRAALTAQHLLSILNNVERNEGTDAVMVHEVAMAIAEALGIDADDYASKVR
jgi:hypothetical protein